MRPGGAIRGGASVENGRRPRPKAPVMQADHRKGRSPLLLYIIGVVIVLVAGVLLLYGGRILRAFVSPAPTAVTTPTISPVPTTTAPSKTATPSAAVTVPPLPASAAAESAAAVKAAALKYPDPPAVTPQTIRSTKPSRRVVAITLDDGVPFDTRILTLLEQKNVKLTTFLTGQAVKAHPDIVKRLDDDGFEIANRTWDSRVLTTLSDSAVRTEIRNCQDRISAITGNQAPYLRPPGGTTDARIQRIAGSMGFRVVLWNRSFGDTGTASAEAIFHNVMDGLQPGDIVIGTWGGKNTYAAMQLILPELEKRGITPVTVSELLKYSSTSAGVAAKQQGAGGAGTRAPTTAEASRAAAAAAATGTAGARARAAAAAAAVAK